MPPSLWNLPSAGGPKRPFGHAGGGVLRRRAPGRRASARRLLVCAGLLCLACAAPKRALGPVEPAFLPAFEALGAAVESGDDAIAERLLANILARGPEGDTLERALGYERILAGRRLARSLRLELALVPSARRPDRVVVQLTARHDLDAPLVLHSLPPVLSVLVTGVDPTGFEQRSAKSVGVGEASMIEVPADGELRLRLGDFPLRAGAALAVRGSFELDYPAGELELDGERYPANELRVTPVSTVRLAEYLPTGPVEPAELLRYIRGERFSTAAMLERAVRIPEDRRAEALDLVVAGSDELTVMELERALPALRWLSGNRHLGADVEAWRRWLAARATEGTNELELPAGGAQ